MSPVQVDEIIEHKSTRLFIILGGFFITNALVAEFIGIKIFSLEATLGFAPFNWTLFGVDNLGFNLTAGVLLWPVVFVMTDVINEYFGQKRVKFLSYLTIGLIFYAFIMVYTAISLSPNEWWAYESGVNTSMPTDAISNMNLAFKKVFGQGLGIIVGSMIAFLIGQIIDVTVFHKIKQVTGEKRVWLRATGSTLISQLIDSYVVLLVAFYWLSDWELVRVLAIGSVNCIYKFIAAIFLTPVIYGAHYLIDQYLGEDLAKRMKESAAED